MNSHQEPIDPGPGRDQGAPPWPRTLARAWRGLCPRCGEGTLFETRFRLRRDCASCELVLRPEQGGMTGQMYLSAAVTELIGVMLAAGLWFLTDWPVWGILVLAVPLIAAFSFWFLPKGMALWVAVDYLTDRHDQAWTPKEKR